MSRVFIERLVLAGHIGINPDEIGRAQPLRLDIEVESSGDGAATSEAIADTVDYSRVADVARAVIARRHYPLVETLADAIARAVLDELPVATAVSLRLGKLTCMEEARAAGVMVTRTRGARGEPPVLVGEALARATAEVHDVLILGGGPAGINAALWAARLGHRALIVDEGAALGGQLHLVFQPMPDLPASAPETGPSYARRLAAQLARADGVAVVRGRVTRIEADDDGVALAVAVPMATEQGAASEGEGEGDDVVEHLLRGATLIVAAGLSRRALGVAGEARLLGKGVLATASKDIGKQRGRRVVVVGGGDAACENALMLAEAGALVTLVHRRGRFAAREQFTQRVAGEPRIRCEMNATVRAFVGEERLEAVELSDGRRIEADAALVRVGWVPRGEVLPDAWRDAHGALRVDSAGRVVGTARVFGAGDIIGPPCLAVATAAGSAANAARGACALVEALGRDD